MKRIRMVIADDEEIERKALRLLIERTLPQIEVVGEAENGKEAIHLALQRSPQLMTVDIKMPGIDGLETIREFTKRRLPIKVIIVSAYDTFAYAQEAIRLGVKEYLLKPSKRETIRETLLRVAEEIMQEEKDLQTRLLLEEELHQYKKALIAHGDRSQDAEQDPIEKVITFLHKHSHQSITLEQAAKEAGMSPYSLSKRFKEEKGINFIDYLTALRIEKAKTLLQDPSRSLKEICYTVGYHDPNYFSRVFKRITGVSPTEYREKMRTL